MIYKQHLAVIVAAIGMLLIATAPAYLGAQSVAGPTCAGVTPNPDGTYAFSWLHVDSSGILRDQDNCEVVLNGFNWSLGHGTASPGNTSVTLANLDSDMNDLKVHMIGNVLRMNFNTKWWVDNTPFPSSGNPQWHGSGTCVPIGQAATIGCHFYRDWVTWNINEAAIHGFYVEMSTDEIFPEPPDCTETYFGFSGVDCSNGGQGDYDYDNAATCTGGTCTTPTCSGATCTSGCTSNGTTPTACQYAPWVNGGSCTTTCTAQYYHNPYVCYDSAVISSTVQTYDALAQTYALSPSVIFQTWNEPYSGGCGRNANTDDDVTGTAGKVVYTNNQTLVNSIVGAGAPTVHQPCFGVAGGTGSTCPESGGWYDHMMTIADVVRNRDPKALVIMGGPQYSNSEEPVTGNPSDPTHFGGSNSEIGGTLYPVMPPFPEKNLLLEHHWYYNNWHTPPTGNYPARANGEAHNAQALGFGAQIGEWGDNKVRDGGICPSGALATFCTAGQLDWTVMCYPLSIAQSHHMGTVYFAPPYLTDFFTAFWTNINGAGLALQQNMAWLRGNPSDPNYVTQPVYWNGTSGTIKSCPSQF